MEEDKKATAEDLTRVRRFRVFDLLVEAVAVVAVFVLRV